MNSSTAELRLLKQISREQYQRFDLVIKVIRPQLWVWAVNKVGRKESEIIVTRHRSRFTACSLIFILNFIPRIKAKVS